MTGSHVIPYAIVAACAAVRGWLPGLAPWADTAAVVAAGAWLVAAARRDAYPELRASEGSRPLLALAAGVAVALLWLPLARLVPPLSERSGFDAGAAGDAARPVLWAARLAASVVVVPFAEELLVRSFLPRFVDSPEVWRSLAPGATSLRAAAVSAAFFALTHPEWLAALAAAVVWSALLARTRSVRDLVISHAAANACLAGWVLVTGDAGWW